MKTLTTNQIGLIRNALELSTRMGGPNSVIAEYENLIEIMKTGCGITVGACGGESQSSATSAKCDVCGHFVTEWNETRSGEVVCAKCLVNYDSE